MRQQECTFVTYIPTDVRGNFILGDFSAALNITNLLAKNVKFILTLDSCVSNLKQIITKGITVKFIKGNQIKFYKNTLS